MRSKKAILNIFTSLMLQVTSIISGFIIPKYIMSAFGSSVNGLVSSITQFLGYIVLLESGFGPVVKAALYKPIADKDKKTQENILRSSEKFFRIIAGIFVIYLLVLAFVYPVIVDSGFSYIYTLSLVIIISLSTVSEYYFGMTYKLYLQADQKTYITSIIQIVGYILNTTAVIVAIKLGAGVHVIKLITAGIFVLRPIAQNIYVKKKYNIDLKTADKNFKLQQKWDGLSQHIASVIHDNTDVTILTVFANMLEVSVYSVYYLIVKGVKSLVQSLSGGIDAIFGEMIVKEEKEQLNKSFSVYEFFYYTLITIVYACTIVLIVPFVSVYTQNITDANYIRPVFGVLIVLSELMWSVRLPYSSITLAAGHFKETRKGAWVESITNIVISLILVNKYGIVGVAIGTLIAMIVRTVEFVYHSSKQILERSLWISIKRISLLVLQVLTVVCIMRIIPALEVTSYTTWILQAIITAGVAVLIVLPINILVYKEESKKSIGIVKGILNKFKIKK